MKPDMNITLRTLGYAGLIPFIALPALHMTGVTYTALSYSALFGFYSVIILGFMAGVLWPARATETQNQRLAFIAVTLPVVSFLALVFIPQSLLWVQLMLFVGLRGTEIALGFDRIYAPYYRTLRWHLTTVVVACHVWMIALSGRGFTLN